MENQRYPIGIQSFRKIVEYGMVYVDKTDYITRLISLPGYYFLSRPRRFGKSLFLSTLAAYFEGRRELFKGLAIDSAEVDWTPRPVIYFDFNAENYSSETGLGDILDRRLAQYEEAYGIVEKGRTFSARFEKIISTSYEQTGMKPVILVDEYDKPLLAVEDDDRLFDESQAILKGFFGVLKTMDSQIHFAMLTGVARFNKVSIFSDLNHLNDISFNEDFAAVCGLTEKELTDYFAPGIRKLSDRLDESFDSTVDRLREYYDGYRFTSRDLQVYNPFSVLLSLYNSALDQYWFQTGTPTFLARRVIEAGISFDNINRSWCDRSKLIEVGIKSKDPIPLMFQTGYLTIKSIDGSDYELDFPNFEVESGFARQLMALYMPELSSENPEFSIRLFRNDLKEGNVDEFMERMQTLLKGVSYGGRSEHFYRNLVYLLFTLMGFGAVVERHSAKGRSDLEVSVGDNFYIFEFKYEGSARKALDQIKSKDYAGRKAMSDKNVYLIGANFSETERGLTDWICEKI